MESAEQIVANVVERVGLSDLGGETFLAGLHALLESIERDARLDPATTAQVDGTIRRRIENRLRIEAWYSNEGRGADDTIEGPL